MPGCCRDPVGSPLPATEGVNVCQTFDIREICVSTPVGSDSVAGFKSSLLRSRDNKRPEQGGGPRVTDYSWTTGVPPRPGVGASTRFRCNPPTVPSDCGGGKRKTSFSGRPGGRVPTVFHIPKQSKNSHGLESPTGNLGSDFHRCPVPLDLVLEEPFSLCGDPCKVGHWGGRREGAGVSVSLMTRLSSLEKDQSS